MTQMFWLMGSVCQGQRTHLKSLQRAEQGKAAGEADDRVLGIRKVGGTRTACPQCWLPSGDGHGGPTCTPGQAASRDAPTNPGARLCTLGARYAGLVHVPPPVPACTSREQRRAHVRCRSHGLAATARQLPARSPAPRCAPAFSGRDGADKVFVSRICQGKLFVLQHLLLPPPLQTQTRCICFCFLNAELGAEKSPFVVGRRGELQIFNWEGKVRGEPLYCAGLCSSSALSVPPLHTLVPTRTTLGMGETCLGGRGRPGSSPSPGAVPVPIGITGAVTVGTVWIHPAMVDVAARSGRAEVGGSRRPPHGLGLASGGGGGQPMVLSTQTWSREGVSVCAHDAEGTPRCPCHGPDHLPSSSSSWFTVPGREDCSLIVNLQLPQQEQNPHQQHGKGAQHLPRTELPQPGCLWGLRWDLLNQREAQDGLSNFHSRAEHRAVPNSSANLPS